MGQGLYCRALYAGLAPGRAGGVGSCWDARARAFPRVGVEAGQSHRRVLVGGKAGNHAAQAGHEDQVVSPDRRACHRRAAASVRWLRCASAAAWVRVRRPPGIPRACRWGQPQQQRLARVAWAPSPDAWACALLHAQSAARTHTARDTAPRAPLTGPHRTPEKSAPTGATALFDGRNGAPQTKPHTAPTAVVPRILPTSAAPKLAITAPAVGFSLITGYFGGSRGKQLKE